MAFEGHWADPTDLVRRPGVGLGGDGFTIRHQAELGEECLGRIRPGLPIARFARPGRPSHQLANSVRHLSPPPWSAPWPQAVLPRRYYLGVALSPLDLRRPNSQGSQVGELEVNPE